jgi:hypothetical protein
MTKFRTQLRNIAGTPSGTLSATDGAAAGTITVDLPCGPRYHNVLLEYSYNSGAGTTPTLVYALQSISEIRIKVNGRVQRKFSGPELRDQNILNGTAYDAIVTVATLASSTQIPIFFAEPWRKDAKDQDALAWPTAGWASFQIEIDVLSPYSDSTTQCSGMALKAWAVTDKFVPADLSRVQIVKWERQNFTLSGTSTDISTISRKDWLQQISLYPAGMAITAGTGAVGTAGVAATRVTLRRDNAIIHELEKAANTALLTTHGMQFTNRLTAGLYDVVLDHDDLLGSAVQLDGTRDVSVTVEAATDMAASNGGSTRCIIQRLGPLD